MGVLINSCYLGLTEITEFDFSIFNIDQDVLGFDISMENSLHVEIVNSLKSLEDDVLV